MRPYTVALTGGVASGKSEVARRFAALGVPLIDADAVARDLVAPATAALDEIVVAFGDGVLDSTGALDRAAMRERIFREPEAKTRLEAILHPRVRDELRQRATSTRGFYVMLAVPLLVEAGGYDWVDRVLVVDAPREAQFARLVPRDGIDAQLANAMLDAQASREQRLALADDVIDNGGVLAALDDKVLQCHRRYLELAALRAGAAR